MDGSVAKKNISGKVIAVPKVDDTLTKKGYAADAEETGKALENRLKVTDVVDNLSTDDATKALSARQGKAIKEQLEKINTSEASTVGYNNTTSGLSATNMQSAIDELDAKADDIASDVEAMARNLDGFDEEYLSKKTGGMVNGPIHTRSVDNGYSSLNKNHSDAADYGTQVVDRTKDGKTAFLGISAALGTFTYTDPDGNIRDVYHEGTKPFGNYKGNGSATPRTIDTKGIGRLLLVYCSTHQAFVSPKGAFVINLTNGEFSWIDSGKVNYLEGKLNTTTANDAFNKADETYYCQGI